MMQNVTPQALEVDRVPVEWQVHFSIKPNALSVTYTVKNTRRQAIYLLNVLWDLTPKGQYEAAKLPLYSCLRNNGELHLAKMILPTPKTSEVEMRIVPFATRVEPGKAFEESLQLPTPVAEYNPYFPAQVDSKFKIVQSHSAVFTLQFINDLPDLEAQSSPLPNSVRLYHPKLLGLVETLQSRPEAVPVKVQKREDQFEEF